MLMKYETNQAEICRHASIWIELLVHPIMANIEAVYAFLDKDARAYVYDLCAKSSQVFEITEYNNTTYSLQLPSTAQYKNLEIVRVVVGNVLNIYSLLSLGCFPALRVLEVTAIKLENIETLKSDTLEELAVIIEGKADPAKKLSYFKLITHYPKLKKLSLNNGTINLDFSDLPETLILISCTIVVGPVRQRPKHLVLIRCQINKLFSGTVSTDIDKVTMGEHEIEFKHTLESLKLTNIDEGIDVEDAENLREVHLNNSSCVIPQWC